jgi:hypothetical protein
MGLKKRFYDISRRGFVWEFYGISMKFLRDFNGIIMGFL